MRAAHASFLTNSTHFKESLTEKWSISKHTTVLPTNAYGTIEFQGNFIGLVFKSIVIFRRSPSIEGAILTSYFRFRSRGHNGTL